MSYTLNATPRVLSSDGRASALHAECRRFDPVSAHQFYSPADCGWAFSLCTSHFKRRNAFKVVKASPAKAF